VSPVAITEERVTSDGPVVIDPHNMKLVIPLLESWDKILTTMGRWHRGSRAQSPQRTPIKKVNETESASPTIAHRLMSPATITTMESKYAQHPKIAEFWCTCTSPFFALPLLLILSHYGAHESSSTACYQSNIPPMTYVAIGLSVMAAVMSTIYHARLTRLWSTCDVCVAVSAYYLHTMALLWVVHHKETKEMKLKRHHTATWVKTLWTMTTSYDPYTFAQTVIMGFIGLFTWKWETTANLSVGLMAALLPVSIGIHMHLQEYLALFFGLSGIACFMLDRKKIAPTHSLYVTFTFSRTATDVLHDPLAWQQSNALFFSILNRWHILGGLSLYFGLEETILLHREYCVV
jgi:hypothetical protein